jgi:hypothetical protein
MYRKIVAKYSGTCSKCGKRYNVGDRIYWEKGNRQKFHANCGVDNSDNPSPSRTPQNHASGAYDPSFIIDWPELKELLVNFLFRGKVESEALRSWWQRDLCRSSSSSFGGYSTDQLKRWLTTGYQSKAIQGLADLSPPIREKRRLQFTDEGDEIHLDLAWSGVDNYMSQWTKRETIPGVTLSLELDASAGSSEALFAYQRWMAEAIYALESSGVDCEVEIFTLSNSLFQGQKGTARTAVRVKRSGEIADFLSFSAMLSPAAFRGIIFSLFKLQGIRQGYGMIGHGSGVTNTWAVKYEPEIKSIVARCNWNEHGAFPAERMTAELRQAIKDLRDNPKGI